VEGRKLVPFIGKRVYVLRQRVGERPTWWPCPPPEGPGATLLRLQGMGAVFLASDGKMHSIGLCFIREIREQGTGVKA